MSLPQAFIDEVRARVTLSTMIARTVKLQRAGNEWKACCPFHQEKSASFYVNDAKGFAHCFGCGWNGDAIKWLEETAGLTFMDALRELAEGVGLDVPANDPAAGARRDRATGLHDIAGHAADHWRAALEGNAGERARAYLDARGVKAELRAAFGIGFAVDSRDAIGAALEGVPRDRLVAAGLLVTPDDDRQPYDRFRNRIMFPIRDPRGRVVGFGGRIMGQGEPKYLNSPDSDLFDKGRLLFNVDRAVKPARAAGRLVVVEGYMDVVGLARAGIAEAVAPMGTAMTEAQLALAWRVVDVPVLCFDGDAAGRRAAVKAATRALPALTAGRSLRFALLPEGSDPDDLTRDGRRDAIESVLSRALPLHELLWGHEYAATPLDTPEARAGLSQRLQAHAETIQDPDVRREYAALFRDRMWPGRRRLPPAPDLERVTWSAERFNAKLAVAVLKGLARYPDVAAANLERVAMMPVPAGACADALALITEAAFAEDAVDLATIAELFPDDRGWKGLVLSFNRELPAGPDRVSATAALVRAVDALSGVPVTVDLDAEDASRGVA